MFDIYFYICFCALNAVKTHLQAHVVSTETKPGVGNLRPTPGFLVLAAVCCWLSIQISYL